MLILKILKGDPGPNEWKGIGNMIECGHSTGIDQPVGINWTIEWQPGTNLKQEKEVKKK